MELVLQAILAEIVALLAQLAVVKLLDWWQARGRPAEGQALALAG